MRKDGRREGVRDEEESRRWGSGAGGGEGSECFMVTGFRFGRMNKFWRWTV